MFVMIIMERSVDE